MELTVTLNHGPLNAEFSGEDREEIQQNLIKFMQFLDENGEIFEGVGYRESEEKDGSPGVDSDYWEEKSMQEQDSNPDTADREDSVLYPISKKVGVSVTDLEEIVYVDEDGEELPQLLIDDLKRLGETVPERQRSAALILLLVWKECYGEEQMRTSDLKDIFAMKDISTSKTDRAWSNKGESWFDSSGHGVSASVKLRGPGERKAYSLLKDLIENDENE